MTPMNISRTEADLKRFTGAKVLVVGDVMLDSYLVGNATRISPEAPVPVVKVEETRHLLGGAGNVARNIAALGGEASLLGIVGSDADGQRLEAMLHEASVKPHLVVSPWRPTTVKMRVLARNQQMIRMDMEDSREAGQGEDRLVEEKLSELLEGHNIIIVSDYDKGVVTRSLVADMLRLRKKKGEIKILVDPKPSHRDYYQGAYLLTPNAKEAGEMARMPVGVREEIMAAGANLSENCGASNILVTLGARGMALFGQEKGAVHIATMARQVFDVTGAGDTVIATIGVALAAGFSLVDACILANYAAGIVVGKVGAATASTKELTEAIRLADPEMTQWT